MSVAVQLDLADPDRGLLREAVAAWPGYEEVPVAVDCLLDLPAWIQGAHPGEVDEVLAVLARLGSPSGGDDVRAAGALAWLLLPGACVVAHRLRSLSPRIDEVVAAQLWLEVRSFPWQRLRKVAANIVRNTRRGVLRELDVGAHLRHVDPTWAGTVPVDTGGDEWFAIDAARAAGPVPAAVELREVLEDAVEERVVDAGDVDLLLRLAVLADGADVRRTGRGHAGLCSRPASEAVAGELGISARTVRRRAASSLQALSHTRARISA